MTKKTSTKPTKKKNTSTQKHPKKNATKSKKNTKKEITITKKINSKLTKVLIVIFGLLLVFSTYAWFSTNLNVKIKTFKMVVTKNSDLSISFDGIDFDHSLEISKETIIDNLARTYPNNLSQWAANGFIPVSSPGITDRSSSLFDMYYTSGVLYPRRDRERKHGFVNTTKSNEEAPREYNYYLAFDVFVKNESGSPVDDNLYLESSTFINGVENISEEMQGLVNSFRIGIVKVGSVDLKASVNQIQGISCNNNCESIIFEPNSKNHTSLSIEKAKKFNVKLVDGIEFPTYAYKKEGGPVYIANSVSGSPNLDPEYFDIQETIDEDDFQSPLFGIPNGITKMRIYVWIEGQDIDSLETDSEGAEVEIGIDFVKDVAGYQAFNE